MFGLLLLLLFVFVSLIDVCVCVLKISRLDSDRLSQSLLFMLESRPALA